MNTESKEAVIEYALKNLASITEGNNLAFTKSGDSIYIILSTGNALKLSKDEVRLQASEYLRSEIDKINKEY